MEPYCATCLDGCRVCDLDGKCLLPPENHYFENGNITNKCSSLSKPIGIDCLVCGVDNCRLCYPQNVCIECEEGFNLKNSTFCECNHDITTSTESQDCKYSQRVFFNIKTKIFYCFFF